MPRKRSSRSYFNPSSHKGSDLLTRPERRERTKFQSTLPQGERPFTTEEAAWKRLFQSTLPQGERRYQIGRMCRGIAFQSTLPQGERQQFYTKFHICFISFLPILSPYHISTHSPLPTFNHFLYIFSGANRPEISCLLPFRTKTISGIL